MDSSAVMGRRGGEPRDQTRNNHPGDDRIIYILIRILYFVQHASARMVMMMMKIGAVMKMTAMF